MSKYQANKEKAIEKAKTFQDSFVNGACYSWQEISDITSELERLAKRYGLIMEFKENGII